MSQLTSPRLPGVPTLQPDATGPVYSRWRRSIKFALETKGTWKYCNGKCPMPMPEAGPNSTTNIQPSLLEERRAWVRRDREVKLDIFLSLADEVMQEVFEVGPPLPPSNLNAREMLKALDEQFVEFQFAPYHHAFCHFLNLHIDQYATIDAFNTEFSATLEDLLDHGQPLSNAQACSAYFSKLRCTQNPWVAKKLQEWDAQSSEPELVDLMGESPPWSFVRPLVTKSSQSFHVVSIPEESLENSSVHSESDAASEPSNASTVSSTTSQSRHTSSTTTHSQEITVQASTGDIVETNSIAFRKELERLPASAIPERRSSKDHGQKTPLLKGTTGVPEATPLNSTKSIAQMALPAPVDRPLPPLPPQAFQRTDTETRSRSTSPPALITVSKSSPQTSLTVPTLKTPPPTSTPTTQSPRLKLETTHPTLRPQTPTPTLATSTELRPTDVHPAFRPKTPTPQASAERLPVDIHPAFRPVNPALTSSLPLKLPDFMSSSPNLAVPWPARPDVPQRPQSSRAALPFNQQRHEQQHQTDDSNPHSDVSPELSPLRLRLPRLSRIESTNSSIISLPLQGTRDSAWEYLYDQTSAMVHHRPPSDHSVSPIEPESEEASVPPPPPPPPTAAGSDITALPQLKGTMSRAPTFDEMMVTPDRQAARCQDSSLAFGSARWSGNSLLESSEEVREREREQEKEREKEQLAKKHRKKRSWSVNVNLARFSASKGVKEII